MQFFLIPRYCCKFFFDYLQYLCLGMAFALNFATKSLHFAIVNACVFRFLFFSFSSFFTVYLKSFRVAIK